MTYKVRLKIKAKKEFAKLPKNMQTRIVNALDELELFPDRVAQANKLKKPLSGYKRRVGKYRILFDVEAQEIFVRTIAKRGKGYKG